MRVCVYYIMLMAIMCCVFVCNGAFSVSLSLSLSLFLSLSPPPHSLPPLPSPPSPPLPPSHQNPPPYLPYEFTYEGMLERVAVLLENQQFCTPHQWPPAEVLETRVSKEGESCKDACYREGMCTLYAMCREHV